MQEQSEYVYDDNKKARMMEVMSMLFGSFFQSKSGDFLISPEKISLIFLGDKNNEDSIKSIISEAIENNRVVGIFDDDGNIDISFLESIIEKFAEDEEDIKYLKGYKRFFEESTTWF